MNRFFEFSQTQMKMLTLLAIIVILGAGFHLLRDSLLRANPTPRPWRVVTLEGYQPTLVLDINSSPADSLEMIPGIGPVLAGRIVAYRQARGQFAAVDSLAAVPGIGAATVEKIRKYLRVAP